MSKLDELMRSSGASLSNSASIRPRPAGMASVSGAGTPQDGRRQGLDRSKTAFSIPVDKIVALSQPREEFDDERLQLLQDSLERDGLLQPITVLWMPDLEKYRIVTGERRYRAALGVGWPSIPCNVLERDLTPDELLALQCVENLVREDLRPIEQAKAYRTLLTVNGWSVTRIAKELGVSHSGVSQTLRLLDLPEPIQKQVEDGELSPVAGYHVAQVDDPVVQAEVVARVVSGHLNRDETAKVVKEAKEKVATARAKKGEGSKAKGVVAKGRGAKSKLPTAKTLKTTSGARVTVEHRKGVDDSVIAKALREILDGMDPPAATEAA